MLDIKTTHYSWLFSGATVSMVAEAGAALTDGCRDARCMEVGPSGVPRGLGPASPAIRAFGPATPPVLLLRIRWLTGMRGPCISGGP